MKTLGLGFFLLGILSIIPAAHSKCKLDLGLVVDKTKSIRKKNLPKLRAALEHLVQRFNISEEETHVSLGTFARRGKLHNKFKQVNFHSEAAVLDLIERRIHGRLRMPTRLDRGIDMAANQMFTEENGLRERVRKVMVLYTDGKSHPNTEQFYLNVLEMKAKGIRVIVVAIGPASRIANHRQALDNIGGENVILIDDYASLDEHTDDILKLVCPPDPCVNSPGMDVAFLLDRTKSLTIADFMLAKGFLGELVSALDISPEATHAAVILFAKEGKVLNTFREEKYYNREALVELIEKIPDKRFMPTRIDRALLAANDLFTEEGGDRGKAPNVVILFTDGKTNPRSQPFSEIVPILKAKGVRLVAIGVGQYEDFEGQLEEIAGNNVHSAESFDQLSNLFETINAECCSVDGGFSRWGFWGACSVTCGGGIETRSRTCTHPPPTGRYGADCEGPEQESRACNVQPCPSE